MGNISVGELKELLKDIPDNYIVVQANMNDKIPVPFHTKNIRVVDKTQRIIIESENVMENLSKKIDEIHQDKE